MHVKNNGKILNGIIAHASLCKAHTPITALKKIGVSLKNESTLEALKIHLKSFLAFQAFYMLDEILGGRPPNWQKYPKVEVGLRLAYEWLQFQMYV